MHITQYLSSFKEQDPVDPAVDSLTISPYVEYIQHVYYILSKTCSQSKLTRQVSIPISHKEAIIGIDVSLLLLCVMRYS